MKTILRILARGGALALLAVSAGAASAPSYVDGLAAKLEPTRTLVYHTTTAAPSGDRERPRPQSDRALRLAIFEPKETAPPEGARPVGVFFHGGGWGGGAPRMMYSFAAWCAAQGGVGVSVEYRRHEVKGGVTVFDCVADALAAVRYVREHAAALRLDPRRIFVGGASAGAHLAVETALQGEDVAALVLFSPVIDTSPDGYGHEKIGARWRELSPRHQVRAGLPPTIVFHGTADVVTPFAGAEAFGAAMVAAGNRCELVVEDGAPHTYMFKDARRYAETLAHTRRFLDELGFFSK